MLGLLPLLPCFLEIDREVFYGLEDSNFGECHSEFEAATVLRFMRLVERMRRSIAHAQLPGHIPYCPWQAYSRPCKTESVVCLHTDASVTHAARPLPPHACHQRTVMSDF